MPKKKSDDFAPLPSTLERSSKKAQDTYEAALESAEKSYDGDEVAAHRVAWGSVKHSFEKTGDHWEPKAKKGPSDERSKAGGPGASGRSFGGVDVEGKTKSDLVEEARTAGATPTSRMTKDDVAQLIVAANRRADKKARDEKR